MGTLTDFCHGSGISGNQGCERHRLWPGLLVGIVSATIGICATISATRSRLPVEPQLSVVAKHGLLQLLAGTRKGPFGGAWTQCPAVAVIEAPKNNAFELQSQNIPSMDFGIPGNSGNSGKSHSKLVSSCFFKVLGPTSHPPTSRN